LQSVTHLLHEAILIRASSDTIVCLMIR